MQPDIMFTAAQAAYRQEELRKAALRNPHRRGRFRHHTRHPDGEPRAQ